jgi:hypothetical protein
MDSLEMMYKMGLKNQAAYQLPQQMQRDQAVAAEDLRTKQLANQQSMVMNPLNAQFKQGEIDQQQAQLPGLQGQAQSLAAQGQYDTQMLSSKVAAGISKNAAQIGDDGMKKLGHNGEIALKVSQMLAQYPPALHKEVAAKAFQTYGGDPDVIQGILNMPDAAVAKGIAVMGQGMAMASSAYLQDKAKNDADNASRERVGAGNNAATIKAAQIMADSRLAAAKARASVIKNLKPEDQITALSGIPAEERTPEEQAQLTQLTQYMLSKAAAGSNQVAPQVMGQQTNQQTAQATGAAIFGGGQPTAQPAGAASDIATYAKQKGLPYDPANYDYKIDPQTGELLKKRK